MSADASPETKPLRHVVAATDFSNAAECGVGWARDIARDHGAKLHLVHAVYPIEPGLAGTEPPFDLTEAVTKYSRERLEEWAHDITASGVPTDYRADFGQPSQVIRRAAEDLEADLVVVATRGLGGFRHLLLGSTAERVVQQAAEPVLAVHATDGTAARPVRRVLLPTDFSEDARLAREAALRVFRLGEGANLHLLHVFHLPPEYQAHRAEGLTALSGHFRDRAFRSFGSELEDLAEELTGTGVKVETEVAEGDPAEVVVSRAAELGSDLIVMGTYGLSALGRVFLGSVARRVVQHAPCPVLTVRNPD